MKYLPFRIWFLVTFTLGLSALIIRFIWQIVVIPTIGTMALMIPLILMLFCLYALVTYFTIKPNLKMLKSLPARILAVVIISAGFISSIIHFARFINSPAADPMLSKVIVYLAILTTIGGFSLLIGIVWYFGKRMKN